VHFADLAGRLGSELVATESIANQIGQDRALLREHAVRRSPEDQEKDHRYRGCEENFVQDFHRLLQID
jgi:hypothetical protein